MVAVGVLVAGWMRRGWLVWWHHMLDGAALPAIWVFGMCGGQDGTARWVHIGAGHWKSSACVEGAGLDCWLLNAAHDWLGQ